MICFMDEAALHELLSGRRRDVGARLLRCGLSAASWGYSFAMALRNAAYDRRWISVENVDVPVISLGNITTGGTGKTPTAAWLTNWLISEGHRPGLLSRGYRALASPTTQDGANPSEPFVTGNDEKLVLDRLCPGVPHLQQRDRVSSARRLVSESGCDVLILDDGFQHRRLHRNLDLVLVDALQPWGYDHVLPRGLLRESRSGLRRASLILITRADQCSHFDRQQLNADVVESGGPSESLEFASRKKAIAFCGIGNPNGFRQTLASFGLVNELRNFADHYHYQPTDFLELAAMAKAASAEIVLTTLKDLVKIPLLLWTGPPLFAVDIGVEFLSGRDLLIDHLRRVTSDE